LTDSQHPRETTVLRPANAADAARAAAPHLLGEREPEGRDTVRWLLMEFRD